MTVYIYGLVCPIVGVIRYVGKTNNPRNRLTTHISTSTTGRFQHYAARWIASVRRAGLKPEMVILKEMHDHEDWESVERAYIANGRALGWRLTNTTPGGEGGGYIRPEDKQEWIRKVTASLQSDEVRSKISARVKAAFANPLVKQVQSRNLSERWKDPEYRRRMAACSMEQKTNFERNRAISLASKTRMQDPAEREHVSRALKAFYATPEGKASKVKASSDPIKKLSAAAIQQEKWKDPAYRAAQTLAKTTAEVIDVQRAKARSQWADPKIREKMLAAMRVAQERKKAQQT